MSAHNGEYGAGFGAGSIRSPLAGTYGEGDLHAGSDSPLHAVAASPDGRWIASAGEDATVRVWNSANGQVAAAQRTKGPLRSYSWRPDSKGLAVGGDRGLYLYELRPA